MGAKCIDKGGADKCTEKPLSPVVKDKCGPLTAENYDKGNIMRCEIDVTGGIGKIAKSIIYGNKAAKTVKVVSTTASVTKRLAQVKSIASEITSKTFNNYKEVHKVLKKAFEGISADLVANSSDAIANMAKIKSIGTITIKSYTKKVKGGTEVTLIIRDTGAGKKAMTSAQKKKSINMIGGNNLATDAIKSSPITISLTTKFGPNGGAVTKYKCNIPDNLLK